jgi:hypothetical protein
MLEILLYCIALVIVPPIAVYVLVKLGTYAFFKGRQLFLDQEKQNDDSA